MKLILGVLDQLYSQKEPVSSGLSAVKSTGQVAEILESKFHVMETFYTLKQNQIADVMADSMAGALTQLLRGRPNPTDPFLQAGQRVETMFRQFLDADEMSKLWAKFGGGPIVAAQGSKRTSRPYAKRMRPAFIDTGLYRISMRAWITGDQTTGAVTSIAA